MSLLCRVGLHKFEYRQKTDYYTVAGYFVWIKQWRYCVRCERAQERSFALQMALSPFPIPWYDIKQKEKVGA